MTSTALVVFAIAILPAFGLAAALWIASVMQTEDMRSFAGFEGLEFDDPACITST